MVEALNRFLEFCLGFNYNLIKGVLVQIVHFLARHVCNLLQFGTQRVCMCHNHTIQVFLDGQVLFATSNRTHISFNFVQRPQMVCKTTILFRETGNGVHLVCHKAQSHVYLA